MVKVGPSDDMKPEQSEHAPPLQKDNLFSQIPVLKVYLGGLLQLVKLQISIFFTMSPSKNQQNKNTGGIKFRGFEINITVYPN